MAWGGFGGFGGFGGGLGGNNSGKGGRGHPGGGSTSASQEAAGRAAQGIGSMGAAQSSSTSRGGVSTSSAPSSDTGSMSAAQSSSTSRGGVSSASSATGRSHPGGGTTSAAQEASYSAPSAPSSPGSEYSGLGGGFTGVGGGGAAQSSFFSGGLGAGGTPTDSFGRSVPGLFSGVSIANNGSLSTSVGFPQGFATPGFNTTNGTQPAVQSAFSPVSTAAPAAASSTFAPVDVPNSVPAVTNPMDGLLGLISSVEAQKTDAYNGLVGSIKGASAPTHANLTGMTLGDVKGLQKGMMSRGHISTAVGAYQTIASTLNEAARELGIPDDAKFDKATQDKIGRHLADKRGFTSFVEGKMSREDFAQNLSKEWAGLPSKTGRSYYSKDGVNKSHTSRESVFSAIDAAKEAAISGNTQAQAKSTAPSFRSTAVDNQMASISNATQQAMARASSYLSPPTAAAAAPARDPYAPTAVKTTSYPAPTYNDDASAVAAVSNGQTAAQRSAVASNRGSQYGSLDWAGVQPTAMDATFDTPEAAPTERSFGQKAVGVAIDAAVGVIPGLGIANAIAGTGFIPGVSSIGTALTSGKFGTTGASVPGEEFANGETDIEEAAAPAASAPMPAIATAVERAEAYFSPVPAPQTTGFESPDQKWGGLNAAIF